MVTLNCMLILFGSAGLIQAKTYTKDYGELWYRIDFSMLAPFFLLANWTIAYIYMKAVIETRALLDKQIHQNNFAKLHSVSKSKRKLKLASFLVLIVCLALGIAQFASFYTPGFKLA